MNDDRQRAAGAARELWVRLAQQAAITGLAHRALTAGSLDALRYDVIGVVRATLRADVTAMVELQPGGHALRIHLDAGAAGAEPRVATDPALVAEVADALERGRVVVLDEGASTGRWQAALGWSVRSSVLAPILGRAAPLGLLAVHAEAPGRFAAEDAGFVEEAASTFGVALENARAAEALRSSEATFRTVVEKSPEILFITRQGVLHYVNPAFVARLGCGSPAAALGRHLLEFIHPADHAAVSRRVEGLCRPDGFAPSEEIRMLDAQGQVVTVEAIGIPIDYQGEPARLGIGRDISMRKELQAQLMLADRLASVGTLVAGVAHEINNPLACVTSNLEYLCAMLEPYGTGINAGALPCGELLAAAREANEAAARMRSTVGDLKTFARGDEVSQDWVDVRKVLESTVSMARREIRSRARLVTELRAVPYVQGSAARLGQVFLNLLLNAAQAIAPGAPQQNEIRIATAAVDGRVVVEVSDTGCGISRDALARIFDPFFTTKPVGVGTGLGLWICHTVVVAHGGEIKVESAVGKGSAFRVELPARAMGL